jgi:hypothetical protein
MAVQMQNVSRVQSSTTTVQTEAYETQVLRLGSQQTPTLHQSVQALFGKIHASSLFQNEVAEKMAAIEDEIQMHQSEPEKSSLLLCRLFFEVISPTQQIFASHPVMKRELDSFEGELKAILQKHLPEGSLEDSYLDRFRDVQQFIRKMKVVDGAFQKKREELYAHANAQIAQLKNDSQARQGRIIALHGGNKALHERAEKEFDKRNAEMEALQETVQQTGSALLQLQKNIQKHDVNLSQTIRSFNVKKGTTNES